MSMPSFANTPLWEKTVGLVGVVLMAATIGFLLWSALDKEETSPNIEVEVKDIIPVSSGYLVNVTVRNSGGRTAESLGVEARLKTREGKSEKAAVTVDYLAPKATKELGFYFTLDPSSGELIFRPLGFQIP